MKEITNSAISPALLDSTMNTLYDLVGKFTGDGLTPAETQDVLCTMVARVLAIHPETAPAQGPAIVGGTHN